MGPERGPDFEDDKIRRWDEPPGQPDEYEDDPSVLSVNAATEEIYESRSYALARGAARQLARSAAQFGIPFQTVVEFSEEMSFKLFAKRRKEDGLLTYVLVFAGLGERHLLLREDRVSEERYRESVADFEASVLRSRLLQPPLVVTREEWREYEEETQPDDRPSETPP